jgi:hypothetical protein
VLASPFVERAFAVAAVRGVECEECDWIDLTANETILDGQPII